VLGNCRATRAVASSGWGCFVMSTTGSAIPSPEAQKEYTEIELAVGRAISTWSTIETQLDMIFHHAIGAADSRLSFAAINHVISFKGRVGMVHQLVRLSLTLMAESATDANQEKIADLQERWPRLYKQALKVSALRNELAHRNVAVHFDSQKDSEGAQRICAARLSLDHSHPKAPRSYEEALRDGFTAAQIVEMNGKIHAAGYALFRFALDLGQLRLDPATPSAAVTISSTKS
jgi:hypothetical protein